MLPVIPSERQPMGAWMPQRNRERGISRLLAASKPEIPARQRMVHGNRWLTFRARNDNTTVMAAKQYYVYILSSISRVLYVGVTNNLERRMYEHRNKLNSGFTAKYNVDRLVYFEVTDNIHVAIEREKQIKAWRRSKKVALIAKTTNIGKT